MRREFVFPTRQAAENAAARVPIPDLGPSQPGGNTGGRTAPATAAVSAQRAVDGAWVVRADESHRPVMQLPTAAERERGVGTSATTMYEDDSLGGGRERHGL